MAKQPTAAMALPFRGDLPTDSLKPHPRNYRKHPADQLEHLAASLKLHGQYKNIVLARDNTILAGHGVWEAAKLAKLPTVFVVALDLDANDPIALKLLAGDNEISNLAADNDRALSEILKEIQANDDIGGLLGTGFDELSLAALALTTRGRDEIASINEAAEWAGMPEFDGGDKWIKLVVKFTSEGDREAFMEKADLKHEFLSGSKSGLIHTTIWPQEGKRDMGAVEFDD